MSQLNLRTGGASRAPDALGAATRQGRDLLAASLTTLMAEGRAYFDDLAKDSAEAFEDLSRCKSPFDLVMAEQRWLMARSKAWFDAGLRFYAGALHEPESAAAARGGFRLPE